MSNIVKQKVQHGSLGYKILNYARFVSRQNDGTFSPEEYQKFRFKGVRPSYVGRTLNALVRNGHLQKLDNGRYGYIETNVLWELDNAYKALLWNKSKHSRHSKRNNPARDLLNEIDSYEL